MNPPLLDDFVWQLEQLVGAVEVPPGSNNVPGITDVCGCFASWCAWCNMTLSVAYSSAGGEHNCWSVPVEMRNAQAGVDGFQWIPDPALGRRGDWPVIDWDGDGAVDHIEGNVQAFDADGNPIPVDDDSTPAIRYHTIGGNVADRCLDQIRTPASGVIVGFVRPAYSVVVVPPKPAPPQPQEDDMPGPISEALAAETLVDGWYQRYLGVPPVGAGDPAHGIPAGTHPDPKGRKYWIELMVVEGRTPAAAEQSFMSEAAKRNAGLR